MTALATISRSFVPPLPRIAIDLIGAGDVVLFLHGSSGNRTNWRHQLLSFGARYRAVAVDMRGYNESEPGDETLSFALVCGDLVRVLDWLGAERCHLVGLSMGGIIAQEFYHRHPDRVASLTLCNTFSGFEDPGLSERVIERRSAPFANGASMDDVAASIAANIVSPHARPDVRREIERTTRTVARHVYLDFVRVTAWFRRTADLARIAVPTLVITGEDDPLMPPAAGEQLARAIPGAQLRVLARCGHVSNLEQPAEFDRALADFLGSVTQSKLEEAHAARGQ